MVVLLVKILTYLIAGVFFAGCLAAIVMSLGEKPEKLEQQDTDSSRDADIPLNRDAASPSFITS